MLIYLEVGDEQNLKLKSEKLWTGPSDSAHSPEGQFCMQSHWKWHWFAVSECEQCWLHCLKFYFWISGPQMFICSAVHLKKKKRSLLFTKCYAKDGGAVSNFVFCIATLGNSIFPSVAPRLVVSVLSPHFLLPLGFPRIFASFGISALFPVKSKFLQQKCQHLLLLQGFCLPTTL